LLEPLVFFLLVWKQHFKQCKVTWKIEEKRRASWNRK